MGIVEGLGVRLDLAYVPYDGVDAAIVALSQTFLDGIQVNGILDADAVERKGVQVNGIVKVFGKR
jgi:hypothetical protein